MTKFAPLKLGNIRWYSLSDIPQLSNQASDTEKSSFNIYFKMRERRVIVIKEGTCFFFVFFFHKEVPDKTSKWTSHAVNSKLLVNISSCALQNIWSMFNVIRRENMLVHVYLSVDIIFASCLHSASQWHLCPSNLKEQNNYAQRHFLFKIRSAAITCFRRKTRDQLFRQLLRGNFILFS